MDKYGSLSGIIADLDHYIGLVEEEGLGTAGLCLRIARMELQMKIHGVTNEEFDALCEFLQSASERRAEAHSCQRDETE
jgi:hypothetical protein